MRAISDELLWLDSQRKQLQRTEILFVVLKRISDLGGGKKGTVFTDKTSIQIGIPLGHYSYTKCPLNFHTQDTLDILIKITLRISFSIQSFKNPNKENQHNITYW